jgi:hypothetical protein
MKTTLRFYLILVKTTNIKRTKNNKWGWWRAQVIECLLSKSKALSSNPNAAKKTLIINAVRMHWGLGGRNPYTMLVGM